MTVSRGVVRGLFAFVVLLLPLSLGARYVTKQEPYPALMLPSFGEVLESKGVVKYSVPQVQGKLADGSVMPLSFSALMPHLDSDSAALFESVLSDPSTTGSVDAKEWLLGRLASAYPGKSFTSIKVDFVNWTYDASSGARVPAGVAQTYEVSLGGGK